jgi:2-dehydro-3-deoxyglucarate aldolase/4-hydroxy-2-oxoheptanedioate aldolase
LIGPSDLQRILQATAPAVPCAVRVPGLDATWLKKCLDCGPAGIIVPNIQSASDAAAAVRLCKYPPEGNRSVGIARAQGYGKTFETYVKDANAQIAIILQIEHIEAVGRIDEILAVPGIDAVFIGPYDLSASMEKTGQISDAEVQRAIETVRARASSAGVAQGIFAVSSDAARSSLEAGYTLLAVGLDSLLIGGAARDVLDALRS